MTDDIWSRLAAEFPREQISWRAQNVKKDGSTALALAYIDARDVMDRLDAVLGPDGWQDAYEVHEHVTICTIMVKSGDAWIAKADGAGDTDVEAEKGRISDAFKRAAVKLGVGRYLYAIPAPWVPCKTWTDQSGKMRWQSWTADPWEYVKTAPKPDQGLAGGKSAELSTSAAQPHWKALVDALDEATTVQQLNGAFERHRPVYDLFPEQFQTATQDHYYARREVLGQPKPVGKKAADEFEAGKALARSEKPYVELTHEQKVAGTP